MTFPPPQVPPPLPRASQSAPKSTEPVREQNSSKRTNNPRPPFRKSSRQRTQQSARTSQTSFTNAIVAINVGLYLWMSVTNFAVTSNNFVISRYFLEQGEWYRLISCGFVHFGLFHVAMNMMLAYQLGQMFEPRIGSLRFGLLYFASLLGGSVGALVMSPDAMTGGASGAVFGLMAAAIVGMRHEGLNPMRSGLGITFVINLVITLTIPGISIGGHFGGAIAGAICGAVVLAPNSWRLPKWLG
ncbi:MAG: rhomboid family intramembrane serine protease, partial [Actinobacteria bacterium]|nr:rhomboid family intramembrane serine protease [Actinomycetota bacterium]